MQGELALVLHAHLPYVRHPEHEFALEESWFYEAVTEVYLPWLERLERMRLEGLRFRLALSLSPTLVSMFEDPLLMGRWRRRHEGLIDLARREVGRHRWQADRQTLARQQGAALESALAFFDRLGGDLIATFRRLEQDGCLELLTCAATHAVLPLLADQPGALRGQIETAIAQHQRWFGRRPKGFWLPECAWSPEIEPALHAAGIEWVTVETHALTRAGARHGVFAPVTTPRGLAVFGRDPASARQVWSREAGYPGDPRYREFHHDLGHEAEFDYIRPYLPGRFARGFTGLKYHAVSRRDQPKALYDPEAAGRAVLEHARHFVAARRSQAERLASVMDQPPILVCPYDAELFGHWWHEGPAFLETVIREVLNEPGLRLATPGDHLAGGGRWQVAEPVESTWGQGGHLGVWLQPDNEWMVRGCRQAAQRFSDQMRRGLASRKTFVRPGRPAVDRRRVWQQAARELLLAQASDWPFIVHARTSPDYAVRRVREHLERFDAIVSRLEEGRLNPPTLEEFERQTPLFPEVDPALWATP